MNTTNQIALRQVPSVAVPAGGHPPTANGPEASFEVRPTLTLLRRARWRARSLGAEAVGEALREARRAAPRSLGVTYWQGGGGHRLTFTGTEQKPGIGKLWTGTLAEYVAWLRDYARELHPKGTGRCLSHSHSLHGGSSDAEMLVRTALFLDCDGLGPWQPVHAWLTELGIAHVLSVKGTDPTSWHLTLFLASPLANPHPGDAEATRAWKARVYQPALGWLLGVFSELAGLRGDGLKDGKPSVSALGFDPKADRLQQLEYAYCRRKEDDPVPEVHYSEGQALDWDALLLATGYESPGDEAPVSGPRRRPAARQTRPQLVPEHDVTDAALVEDLARADSPAWRSGGLDLGARTLGGALGHLGFSATRAAAIVYAAAVGAGVRAHAASMAEKADRAARRALKGLAVPQLGHLAHVFPELHTVVQRHVPLATHVVVSSPDAPSLPSASDTHERLQSALRLSAGARLILATPGLGKSEWLRRQLASADEPVALYVPTHDLADQVAAGLAAFGVQASVPRGVTRLRVLPSSSEADAPTLARASACVQHDAAEALLRAGASPRRLLCSHCPERNHHPSGGPCPAYASGASPARVTVLQQASLARSLASLTRALGDDTHAVDTEPPVRLAVVDEVPAVVISVDLGPTPTSLLTLGHDERSRLRPDVLEALGPVLAALTVVLASWSPPTAQENTPLGATLRELLTASGVGDVEAMLDAVRALDPDALFAPGPLAALARAALDPELAGWALSVLDQLGSLHARLAGWLEAVHAPDVPCVLPLGETWGLVVRARWTREARRFVVAGGRLLLLDATANADALRTALALPALDVVQLDVRDAPGVSRTFVSWGSGARSRHSFDDKTPKLEACRGPLRHLAQNAALVDAHEVGVLTDKPLALALRRLLSGGASDAERTAVLPRELLDLRARGVRFEVGWYGAQRGLDRWAECDVVATLGDPWPCVPVAQAHARALGLEPEAFVERLAQEELTQAWGRARGVHRDKPVQVLHYGALAPDLELAPQWSGTPSDALPNGRPRALDALGQPLAPWDWAEEREGSGASTSAHARGMGVNRHTYRRRLHTAGLVTALGRSGRERRDPLDAVSLGGAQNPLGDSAGGDLGTAIEVGDHPTATPKTRRREFCAPPSVVRRLVGADPPWPPPSGPPPTRVANVALLAALAAAEGPYRVPPGGRRGGRGGRVWARPGRGFQARSLGWTRRRVRAGRGKPPRPEGLAAPTLR
jgi:hypothetical protein